MDTKTLSYNYDEETLGFEEPVIYEQERLAIGEKICLSMVGAGILALVLQILSGSGGSWTGLLLTFGLPAVGGAGYFYLAYKERNSGH